ncbi:MAG: (5-formylfuran-3-yl)methyl phosphate synthase [Phyllobacterium sp.]
MTKMLASIRNREEAEIVLQAGADIIDLKDPARGALGAVETGEIADVVDWVASRRLTSAACGDLPMKPEVIRAKVEEIAATGVDFIKIGFFPSDRLAACANVLQTVSKDKKLIAVLFADHVYDGDLLAPFLDAGFHGVMIDTDDKSKGRLLHHLTPDRAGAFVSDCHDRGLAAGLAGSLEAPDIPRLLACKPDFLGFRGALCGGLVRNALVDKDAADRIRALIPEEQQAGAGPRVDYQLLAARGYFPDASEMGLGTDKIFVRDFVLPVHIGAYSFEHGKTQKVRFDVTADVLRVTRNPEDMRHVVSYDLIMDGIRAIVARGHVELAETLAEQIAAFVLENPRVTHVVVRAEKLELGPGGVGVIIERKQERARSSKSRGASDREQTKAHGGRGGYP